MTVAMLINLTGGGNTQVNSKEVFKETLEHLTLWEADRCNEDLSLLAGLRARPTALG